MPHSDQGGCPYCGAALLPGKEACAAHDDLLALEPLDDRYLLTEDEA